MKFNEIQILCLTLLFFLITNQEIPIINFSENNYEIETNLFIYEPEPIISSENEGEVFFSSYFLDYILLLYMFMKVIQTDILIYILMMQTYYINLKFLI